MVIDFQIKGIKHKDVIYLFKLSDYDLEKVYAQRILVKQSHCYPCRVSLQDAEIGETIIATHFTHHDVKSPYKSSGPIFIREKCLSANLENNELPQVLDNRHLSLRAYDVKNMMIDALTTQTNGIKKTIQKLFENSNVEYMHIHNAKPGCYSCSVQRAC